MKVVAIDLSSNMIKIGMERAEEMGISLLDVINLQHELILKQSNKFTASAYLNSLINLQHQLTQTV